MSRTPGRAPAVRRLRARPAPAYYLAILADLQGSRSLRDRAGVQGRLKAMLRAMKARQPLRAVRAAGPEITLGDEFEVLLRAEPDALPGAAALAFLRELSEDLPVGVAFGLGFGTLTTPVAEPVRELDGPCFHHARSALELAKHEERWAVVHGIPERFELAVNAILRLTGDLRGAWTERQREIVRERRRTALQKDVARALRVTPSVISAALKSARHDAILEAEAAGVALLDEGILAQIAQDTSEGAAPEPRRVRP